MKGIFRNAYYSEQLANEGYETDPQIPPLVGPGEKSNLYGSPRLDGRHEPTLDIDHHCTLVESSTQGHFHLYIDVPMSWEQYQKLLDVMAEVGILEVGYVSVSKKRGGTFVRTPWVKK